MPADNVDPALPTTQLSLEREKLALERLKIRLDYRKFVLGSVFVALAIAAIPPLFQLATAGLEYVKSNADRRTKQQEFREGYIKEFISNALNQDIELRIRFAQYFAKVSTDQFRQDWENYHQELRATRAQIRALIDKMENEWNVAASASQRDQAAVERLERNLAWAYKEVGYVERNRSAAVNPRAPEPSPAPSTSPAPALPSSTTFHISRFQEPVFFLTRPFVWTPQGDAVGKFEPVEIPAGFVTELAAVPHIFWTMLPPDGGHTIPAVLLDYLYWSQARPRAVADEIFRIALRDMGIETVTAQLLYQAVRSGGQASWNANAKAKAQGEKRILKEYPSDPRARWVDYKKRPEVFAD